MKTRSKYDKIFQKVWGASGGWANLMCPCGQVVSLKFNIRAESPRDFTDLLLSWKHMPNICIYDFARGLVLYANLREPDTMPFSPHEGSLLDPSHENLQWASNGGMVSLPWLNTRKALDYVLDSEGDPEEEIVQAQNSILKRSDFWTLGLERDVEAMIANCCFNIIVKTANAHGIATMAVDAYVVVTWLPPYEASPIAEMIGDFASKDVVLLPAWQPGHWTLCVSKPTAVIIEPSSMLCWYISCSTSQRF
ncbi:hypothetical protein ABVT39_004092 [Epinephelus coioides]